MHGRPSYAAQGSGSLAAAVLFFRWRQASAVAAADALMSQSGGEWVVKHLLPGADEGERLELKLSRSPEHQVLSAVVFVCATSPEQQAAIQQCECAQGPGPGGAARAPPRSSALLHSAH